jgi:MFS family permease
LRNALRNSSFRALWGAQAIATTGHQVAAFALPTLAITELHASALQVGIITALGFLPSTVLGVLAGLVADRWSKRRLMLVAESGRAFVIGLVALATFFGHMPLGLIYVAAAVSGLLGLMFEVAYQSYVPELIVARDLAGANGALEINRSGGTVMGPALSGGLIHVVGIAGALFSAAAALAASVGVLSIAGSGPSKKSARHPGLWADLREGLGAVLFDRRLLFISLCTATSNLGAFAFSAVALVFAYRTLGMSPGQYGIVAAVGNLGLVGGAVAAAPLARRFGIGRTLFGAIGLVGVAMALTPLAAIGLAAVVLASSQLITNFMLPVYGINQVALRQSITPRDLQGRMNSVMRTIALSTIPMGSIAGGMLAGQVGPTAAMSIAGGVACLAPLWLIGLLSLDRLPAQPAVDRHRTQNPAAMPSTVPAAAFANG